jgi:structural maintenance of chromosome 3 (chondroitin sulfate proteoglycan 6)
MRSCQLTSSVCSAHVQRKDGSGHSVVQGEAYKAAKEAVQSAEEQIEQLQASIKKAQASKSTLTQQQSDLLKRRTELELNVKDVSDRLSGAKGSKDEAAKELKAVQKKVDEARHKLEGLTAEYTRVAAEEEEQAVAYQRLDQRLADLASKRDRSAKYANKKERDADIKKQIARVSKQKADLTKQLESLQAKISESQSASDALSKDIDSKEKQIAKNRDAGEKVNAKLDDLTKRAAEGINARKHAWKKESELASEHTEMSARMEKAQRNLQQTMDKDMHRGLEAIKTIAAELNLDGVYGPLIELFECKEEFHPCVEITAGNSLFSVVVNNSKTAARLIEELQRRKAGRVTFIPLENITPHKPDYPSTQDAMPMLDQLRYDPRFTKAFVQVFGKTLIARDITVAAQLAFAHDLNTITLSGDRVDKKGALTGGFSDLAERGKSRLGAQAEIASQKTRFAEVEAELRSVQGDIATLSAQIEKIQAEMAKHQEHKAQLRSQTKQLTDDVQQAKKEQKALAAEIASNEKLLPPLRASLASTETQLESLESESRGDFHSGLTEEEEGELKRLTGELDQAKKALMKVRASKAEVEASKVQLESLINANLGRREEELNARLYAATQEDDAEALARDEQELAIVRQQVKELEEEMKASEKELHDSTEQSRKLLNDLDKLRVSPRVRPRTRWCEEQ